jgi:hypothetical protein
MREEGQGGSNMAAASKTTRDVVQKAAREKARKEAGPRLQ